MAIELKILCKCGSKYKFDVEPVNSRLPAPVACPVCKLDGTEEGNRILEELVSVNVSNESQTGAPAVSVAPTAEANVPRAAVPAVPRNAAEYAAARQSTAAPLSPPKPDGTGVSRIHVAAVAHPEPVPAPAAIPAPSAPIPPASKQKYANGDSRMGLGVLGSIVSGIIGLIVWYYVLLNLRRAGWGAWGVGLIVGYGTLLLARRGSRALGLTAGAVALVVILLGQFMANNTIRNETEALISQTITEMYDADLAFSKKAVAAKSDEELKTVIAEINSEEGDRITEADITTEELADFKREELPNLRKLANGSLTKTEYRKERQAMLAPFLELGVRNAFSFVTLIFLFLGVGTAFQVAAKV
ncbi:MAG: hypothetical protein ACO1QB_05715 [Verrucomicrobiales bacterium]